MKTRWFCSNTVLHFDFFQAAFTSVGWPSDVVKTAYYVTFFLWLATVHAWIAFKAELFPMDFYRYVLGAR